MRAGIISIYTESYHVDISADIEVTIRVGRRFFLCFHKPLFSTPFRNNMAFSTRLIITLPCTTVYHKRMKYDSTAYLLISHQTTRDTTRAGVNLYLQNGIISCRLKKMLISSIHTSIFTSHI